MATRIAGDYRTDTAGFLVHGIKAPEASTTKYKSFHDLFNGLEGLMIPAIPYGTITPLGRYGSYQNCPIGSSR